MCVCVPIYVCLSVRVCVCLCVCMLVCVRTCVCMCVSECVTVHLAANEPFRSSGVLISSVCFLRPLRVLTRRLFSLVGFAVVLRLRPLYL